MYLYNKETRARFPNLAGREGQNRPSAMMQTLQALLLLLGLLLGDANGESEVCIVGYPMDVYCIQRGSLLDTGDPTLRSPERHSVHCLVDVSLCRNSGYEILEEDANEEGAHGRAVALDAYGNSEIIRVARLLGTCSTCSAGGIRSGLKLAVIGTPTGSGSPRTLAVSAVRSEAEGCGGVPLATVEDIGNATFTTGAAAKPYEAHGTLMLVSWGLLLPCGAMAAKFRAILGDGWLFCHVMCQCIGLFLATIGLVLALANFDHYVFRKDATIAMYAHGVIGCVLMAVGLLQPLNALLRPHTPAEGHSKTKLRTAWEWLHKSSGYFVLLIAIGQAKSHKSHCKSHKSHCTIVLSIHGSTTPHGSFLVCFFLTSSHTRPSFSLFSLSVFSLSSNGPFSLSLQMALGVTLTPETSNKRELGIGLGACLFVSGALLMAACVYGFMARNKGGKPVFAADGV